VKKEEFSDLVVTYQQSMYRFALGIVRNRQDAEDALSSAIIKAYEHLASLRDKDKFKAWIMTILANEAKNILSKNSRVQLVDDVTVYEGEVKEAQNDVWDCVMELGEQHRQIVILYYYDGFSTREIARILKIPEGTVKSRLSRARQNLKETLCL
jgi:RNA polymerase sigma-70 factor (ECF subfamily)